MVAMGPIANRLAAPVRAMSVRDTAVRLSGLEISRNPSKLETRG